MQNREQKTKELNNPLFFSGYPFEKKIPISLKNTRNRRLALPIVASFSYKKIRPSVS